MSWQEKIKTKFKIITGDEKEFFPYWKNSNKSREYNTKIFDYIDKDGSYVDRKKQKSAKFDLVIYFQGEDYLEVCDEFEKSASDPRAWTIEHPLYGTLLGQPLSLARNDAALNNTEISIEFWESNQIGVPKKIESVQDQIAANKEELYVALAGAYEGKVILKPFDQNSLQGKINHIDSQYSPLLDDENYNEYRVTLGESRSNVYNIFNDSNAAMKSINELLNTPSRFKFETSIEYKIRIMLEIYNSLKRDLFKKNNRNNKAFFESAGAAIISGICQIVLKPNADDYPSRTQVEQVSFELNSLYSDYKEIMDAAQSPIEDLNNGFSLDFASQFMLGTIMNITLYNLFSIAFSAKQERSVEVQRDTNLIILTHRYFGLDENDLNIEKFRKLNNIVNDKVFGIKKGTVIKYLA